ncbi:retropepsin-like aspartic protease [Gracilimonas sp. BCB1]|uniref:retropepsin-like aspartic protease n=1 Tax=Gracilimonas sp. BCB1 TaxID=3152362 RepID=UPI0032D95170
MKKKVLLVLGLFLVTSPVSGMQNQPVWITEGPYLVNPSASFEIPIKLLATKLYVKVEIGGEERRFVVDTGSPSMIDARLANELGLEVVDTNKGRDAHGSIIETNIVQAGMTIGGEEFRKVPMMTADFSNSPATRLFIGDGVIGSELLPLGLWQLDLKNSVLRFNTDLNKLPYLNDAKELTLYQFGYPYMPIFDVTFSKHARSKAMFDTGSPSFFTISSKDLDGARKNSKTERSLSGYGSPGTSLGGQAAETDLLLTMLPALSIGKLPLGAVSAYRRDLSPSLIGASMLEHFIITLDARSGKAYFKQYSDGSYVIRSFGFTLAFDNTISVAAVWDGSPAKIAGLRPGMELISVNGSKTEFSMEGIRRVIDAMNRENIELVWKDGSATLTKEVLLPPN